ncbi:MAG: NAD(P)-dependent alcohol dehydrogenase, partial [Pedobacter sp.]
MKAAAINRYGSADVIEFAEVPKPTIKPNQLLLKVHYASINPVDWKMRNGRFKLILGNKFPKVLGLECAGEVVEIGKNITKFKVGDRIIGSSFPGCYAEFTAVNENKAVKIPDSLSYADASTIPVACMTAYFSLFDLGKLNKGDKVLLNGASGGVGLFAVQIAHIIGADITAVCSEKNFNLVKSFGDNIRLVDYHKTDVTKENIQYKVVFDIVNS